MFGEKAVQTFNFQLLNFHAKCCFKIETFWNKKHKKTFEFVCVTLMCWTTICFLECVIRFIVKHIRVLTWLEFYYQHKLLFVCFALVWFSSFFDMLLDWMVVIKSVQMKWKFGRVNVTSFLDDLQQKKTRTKSSSPIWHVLALNWSN